MPVKTTVRVKSNGTGRCLAIGAATLGAPLGGAAARRREKHGKKRGAAVEIERGGAGLLRRISEKQSGAEAARYE
jgi:hypothetical protein